MSLVLVFGRDDPARVRFAISPLWETMAALRVLLEPQRRRYHLPWLDAVRADLDRLELWPLLALSPAVKVRLPSELTKIWRYVAPKKGKAKGRSSWRESSSPRARMGVPCEAEVAS